MDSVVYLQIIVFVLRYKDGRYPENTVKLLIHNNSSLEAEIHFTFQHDTHAATFLLDPPTMTLKPDQKQVPPPLPIVLIFLFF